MADAATTELSLRLPPMPASIPRARHMLDALAGNLDGSLFDDLQLLVSEVVTNSIRHGSGGGGVDLRVSIDPRTVRVEVEDPGPGFRPQVRDGDAVRDTGWGLLLVDRLASRWGVVAAGCTRVWFELDRPRGVHDGR